VVSGKKVCDGMISRRYSSVTRAGSRSASPSQNLPRKGRRRATDGCWKRCTPSFKAFKLVPIKSLEPAIIEESGSHMTRCWREQDSNPRSPVSEGSGLADKMIVDFDLDELRSTDPPRG
jgi:hypothetical protein